MIRTHDSAHDAAALIAYEAVRAAALTAVDAAEHAPEHAAESATECSAASSAVHVALHAELAARRRGASGGLLLLVSTLLAVLATVMFAPGLEAQTVYSSDFPSGDVTGWSTPTITNPLWERPIAIGQSPNGRRFLGDFGDQRVSFALGGLPQHDSLVVEVELYVIRSWDGSDGDVDGPDLFVVSDSERGELLRTTFSNKEDHRQAYPGTYPGSVNPAFTGAEAISSLGYAEGDAVYRMRLAYVHTGPTLDLTFEGDLRDRFAWIFNESWAIGTMRVTAVKRRDPSATLLAGNAVGAPGDVVYVPIYLRDVVGVEGSGATSIRTTVRFNGTMLLPESPTPKGRIENGDRVIDLELPVMLIGDSTIGTLVLRAAVGDDTLAPITLERSEAIGGTIVLTERPGRFRMVGLCTDGGARLYRHQRAVLLRAPTPNPSKGHSAITFELAAAAHARLDIIDATGAIATTLVDDLTPAGTHSLILPDLPAGRYTLRLRALDATETTPLLITP